MDQKEKDAEANKVAEAAGQKSPPPKVELTGEQKAVEVPKKNKEAISKKLAAEGFHNCSLFELKKGQDQNISGFGKELKKIKAMHESNIDDYNTQQINSLRFIKKDNVKYEMESIYAKGRVDSKGAPKPYKYFVEVTSKKKQL